jgi:hypothetical protein
VDAAAPAREDDERADYEILSMKIIAGQVRASACSAL